MTEITTEAELRALIDEPAELVRNPDRYRSGAELPSAGAIHRRLNPGFDAERYDTERAERYARREGLYE